MSLNWLIYLGKFTNEIKGDNYIQEFVSAGPKNYGYKLNNGQTSCKIIGFSVNFIASESLNFQSMRDLVLNQNFNKIDKFTIKEFYLKILRPYPFNNIIKLFQNLKLF
jgi:hypothetical protein